MTFEPHKISEETYLAYTGADNFSSPARQARLVPASAGGNTGENNPVKCAQIPLLIRN